MPPTEADSSGLAVHDISEPTSPRHPIAAPPHRSARYSALSDLIQAYCWSEGHIAPEPWVHWLLDLELRALARRNETGTAAAEQAMPLSYATELGASLVQIARSSQNPSAYE